jgi:hypothetical protein
MAFLATMNFGPQLNKNKKKKIHNDEEKFSFKKLTLLLLSSSQV